MIFEKRNNSGRMMQKIVLPSPNSKAMPKGCLRRIDTASDPYIK